ELHDDKTGIYHVANLVRPSSAIPRRPPAHSKGPPRQPGVRTELEDFRATVTDSGRWTFGARGPARRPCPRSRAGLLARQPMRIHPSVLARSTQLRRSHLGDRWSRG